MSAGAISSVGSLAARRSQPGSAAPKRSLLLEFPTVFGGMLATALVAGFLCTVIVKLSPGFGLDELALDPTLSAETADAMRLSSEASENSLSVYVKWLRHAATGDLGFSRSLGQPVRDLLAERIPVTAALMAYGISGAWFLAFLAAVPAAVFRAAALSALADWSSVLLACLPAAGIAVVVFQCGGPPKFMLPIVLFPRLYSYTRNLLQEGIRQPRVILAAAKGLGRSRILLTHVMLPSLAQFFALGAVSVNMAFAAAVAV